MKKLIVGVLSAAVLAFGLVPAQAATEYVATQKTLASFSASATGLTILQRSQVKAAVEANPNAEKFICTGIRYVSQPMSENIKVRKRAKAACDYAKQLNPALSTWFQNKPTNARSYAGKVLLTIKTPIEVGETAASSIVDRVPQTKSLAALGSHVRAVEFAALKLAPIEIKYAVGPTADPVRVKLVVERFQGKLKMYQLLGLRKLDMDWVIASEKDHGWWRDYRLAQEPNYPIELWDVAKNELGHCRLSSDVFCGAGNGVNGKNYQDNVVGTRFVDRGLDSVSRHEAAHFYQTEFGYGGRCWFAEGQATFFETYLESSSRPRSQVLGRLKQSPASVSKLTEAQLVEKLRSDRVCDGDSNIAYDMGMLVFEYLYMNYSLREIHDMQVLASNGSWSFATSQVLGVNSDQLDAAIAGYVFTAMQKV